MKHTSHDKDHTFLYLEPYVFSVISGNNTLIYNSLSGGILEYYDKPGIAGLIRQAEDPETGFLAPLPSPGLDPEIESLVNAIRESFAGDVIQCRENRPSVIRPRPVIKNHPPARDFPSFSADDYLKNIYFFLNEDNDELTSDYRLAASQFHCPVFHEKGYRELPAETIINALDPYRGITGIAVDISGSDISKHSAVGTLIPGLKSLSVPLTFHLPFPCHDPATVAELLSVKNSRLAFYIMMPKALPYLGSLISDQVIRQKSNRTVFNFIVRSMEEFSLASEFIARNPMGKVFFLPYYDGSNEDFFKTNVFLSKNDILGLKPTQKQVFARKLINEQQFGKIFIRPDGEAFANLAFGRIGNMFTDNLSNLVRNELYEGRTWHLTRMKASPCSDCLYQIFCPPIGNYEITLNRFNFCDVI